MDDQAHLYNVEIETATGRARGRMAVQSGPMGLADLVPLACELADLQAKHAAVAEQRAGRSISCAAGCGACCRQLVPVSAPEVFHLGRLIGRASREHSEHWRQGFDRVIRASSENGLRARLTAPDLEPEESIELAQGWFQMGVPCPFLENESCGIHAVRPAVCREYNVTSPAAWCANPLEHEIERVPVPRSLSEALARLTSRLTGVEMRMIPLGLAPLWASAHADLDGLRWPGPDLFRQFIELLGGSGEIADD